MKEPIRIVYLFHIYQPHWQTREVLEDNYNKFYLPLLQVLETNPNYKITLNISASLTEQLVRENKIDFFDRVKALAKKGQIELVGSAAYHPVLPLIPEEEVIRQIKLNDEINSKYFGEEWRRKGFFIPELAYSQEVSKVIKSLGFDWISIDQTAVGENIDWNNLYIDKSSGIKLLINNRVFYTPDEHKFSHNKYNVLISDGENQINKDENDIDWSMYLKKTEPDSEYIYLTGSEYLDEVKENKLEIETEKSNWQLRKEEKEVNSYYHLWKNDSEPIHKMLWDLLYEVMKIVNENSEDKNFNLARTELDKSLASCTLWWVDGRIYGYDPTAIELGAHAMVNSIRSLMDLDKETRIKIEKLYSELLFKVWERHWQNFNKK